MKTSELSGAALDWAVIAANEKTFDEGRVVKVCRREATAPAWIELENSPGSAPYFHRYSPSTDWAQGGPIIERENIFTYPSHLLGHGFSASKWKHPIDVKIGNEFICKVDYAPTRLIAAMRCYCASKLGDEIEIPEELR